MTKYTVTAVLILFFTMSTNLFSEETVTYLLNSNDWQNKSKAVSIIDRNIGKYKDDDSVKNLLLQTLEEENNRLKYLRKNKIVDPEPGRGEYYIGLIDLAIRLKIADATELLVDNADLGKKVEDAIVEELVNDDKQLQTLGQISKSYNSEDIFYKSKRDSYLSIVNKLLARNKGVMDNKRKNILIQMIDKGLSSDNFYEKRHAIHASKYLMDDQEILKKLQKLSVEDRSTTRENDAKINIIKKEANEILRESKQKLSPK